MTIFHRERCKTFNAFCFMVNCPAWFLYQLHFFLIVYGYLCFHFARIWWKKITENILSSVINPKWKKPLIHNTILVTDIPRKSSLGINLSILFSKGSTRICFHYLNSYFSCIRMLIRLLYFFLSLTFYCNRCVTSIVSCMTNVIFSNTQVLYFVNMCVFRERNRKYYIKIGHEKERQNNMHILQPKLWMSEVSTEGWDNWTPYGRDIWQVFSFLYMKSVLLYPTYLCFMLWVENRYV